MSKYINLIPNLSYIPVIVFAAITTIPDAVIAQSKASTLDSLMGGSQAVRDASVTTLTKAEFLTEFESDYQEKSDDGGRLPGMKQRPDKVAKGLAAMLPSEFGVSVSCVQQPARDGQMHGTSQAMTIASAMYDVIDELVPSANKGGMLRNRVNSLSQLGTGCPKDFLAIKKFLTEYSDFAKNMVARRKSQTAERVSKVNEIVAASNLDKPNGASIKGNTVFARIESSYKPKSDQKAEPISPIGSLEQFDELIKMLTSEYGISLDCLRERSSNGKGGETGPARAIAYSMKSILVYGWRMKYAPETADISRVNKDIDPLSKKPPYGCPADFEKIKRFLSDFTIFSKAMIDRKESETVARVQQKEVAQRIKEIQDKARMLSLRTGKEKPASFRDYMLMHDYGTGDQFYGNPLLKADNKVYLFGTGALDREEDNGLLVKSPSGGYIHVKTNGSTPIYGELRINMPVVIIGRYVGNAQYTTVSGAIRTAPIIEAIAISKAPVYY